MDGIHITSVLTFKRRILENVSFIKTVPLTFLVALEVLEYNI